MAKQKSLAEVIAGMKADGITIEVKLANPNQDSVSRRIRDAAEEAGIAYVSPQSHDLSTGEHRG